MKIGIVGLGYWGNIILKNLEDLGINKIILCDISSSKREKSKSYAFCNEYRKLDCEYIFIATPLLTHFKICKHFLENEIHVFCEKPLTTTSKEAEILYDIALKKKVILFTDWIFTFNSHVNTIKRDYENSKLGQIKSIFMNRLNLGPERQDVSARWDLASHDISIIQYLFSEIPLNAKWFDYKRNKYSKQSDSTLGLIEYNDFSATINASWQYRKKVRECIFEFEKYFVIWDDFKRFLQYEDSTNLSFPIYSGNLSYPCNSYHEPLKKVIKSFFSFSEEDIINQKKLTIETLRILEGWG